jgi:hypothetical protein
MYKSHVAEGRLLKVSDDYMVTVQGDMVSTYHRRYYLLPEEEQGAEAAGSMQEQAESADRMKRTGSYIGWKIKWPQFVLRPFMARGANRM